MMTLGLETSEAWGGVALCQKQTGLGKVTLEEPLRHAEALLPALERLLAECGVEKEGIELVSVNRGPGSFTGLRIGIATAKGLCQSLGVPLVGVEGTAAYRARVAGEALVCVVIPCRLDLVYVQWFGRKGPRSEVRVMKRSALLSRVRGEGRSLCVVGSGAEAIRQDLEGIPGVKVAEREANRPSPEWVARLGEEGYRKDELYLLEPAYADAGLAAP